MKNSKMDKKVYEEENSGESQIYISCLDGDGEFSNNSTCSSA